MSKNIRDEIIAKRRQRIQTLGHAEGVNIPPRREAPLVPFLAGNSLICEVKRRSPSKGDIAPALDAAAQAGIYHNAGAANFSVLTEPEGFGGSLADLIQVKRAFPEAAVLRKDFLFDPEDVDMAHRAGADAVLLIAGMLTADELAALYRRTKNLGMEALVEIHDADDLAKARPIRPNLVGINSRDLTTFRIDPLLPLKVKSGIDWPASVIYESGITHEEQAHFAMSSGFGGLLVGEGVVRDPGLAGRILDAMAKAKPTRFWPEIGKKLTAAPSRPLVKVCGLTREDDARLAAELGADVLGFVFWPESPRAASPDLVRKLRDVQTPKIAVVVNPSNAAALDPAVLELLKDGFLDAVQLHGDEQPDDCFRLWPVSYKALRRKSPGFRSPRVLLDASGDAPGGTGKRVADDVLDGWAEPLWLAGGITPENVAGIAAERRPELVDVASGVESEPGAKCAAKMRKFFTELGR